MQKLKAFKRKSKLRINDKINVTRVLQRTKDFLSKSILYLCESIIKKNEQTSWFYNVLKTHILITSNSQCLKPKPKHDQLNSHVQLRHDYRPLCTMDVCHNLAKCPAEKHC